MPWFVNGTLSDSERDMVATHMQRCAACRHESRWLQSLQSAVSEEAQDEAMQMGLDRALARIGQAERPGLTLTGKARQIGRRCRHWLDLMWQSRPLAVKMSYATVALVLLGSLLRVAIEPAGMPAATYRTLSSPYAPAQASSRQAQIAVVFSPSLTPHDIQGLLNQVGAQLLSGPTPEGAYVVQADSNKRVDVLRALQDHPGVRFAQPAEGTALEQP